MKALSIRLKNGVKEQVKFKNSLFHILNDAILFRKVNLVGKTNKKCREFPSLEHVNALWSIQQLASTRQKMKGLEN